MTLQDQPRYIRIARARATFCSSRRYVKRPLAWIAAHIQKRPLPIDSTTIHIFQYISNSSIGVHVRALNRKPPVQRYHESGIENV